jgi:GNAT superfamily N-acetyltransferase
MEFQPTVRPAEAADRDDLIALNPGLARGGPGARRTFRALDDGTVLIATADGRVVGYAAMDYGFFDRGFVEYLVVRPDLRRRGIGLALMSAARRTCATPQLFTSTNASNVPMRELLKKLGFRPCGRVEELDPGDPELFFVHP